MKNEMKSRIVFALIFARGIYAKRFYVQLIYEINTHIHIYIHIIYKTNVFANEILSLDI